MKNVPVSGITFDGKPCTVDINSTHKLQEIELSSAASADTGRDPAANAKRTALAEGTRPLNVDSTIAQAPDPVNADTAEAAAQAAPGPVQAGRVTTIQHPYQGKTPVQTQKSAAVTVDSGEAGPAGESAPDGSKRRVCGQRGVCTTQRQEPLLSA